jgi:hypothetical protein
MTIDEAIKVLRQHNEKGTSVLRITKGQALEKDLLAQVLDSCEQLISERAEYKRLLKLAVEDFETIESNLEYDEHCVIKTHSVRCDECPLSAATIYRCKWRHADEALALIEKGGDANG